MKILKIFGIVVAVHAAVFVFIFAIPGCRSTGKGNASAAAPETPPGGAAITNGDTAAPGTFTPAPGGGGNPGRDLNPALVPAGNTVTFDPTLPAGGVRVAPTRPGSTPAGNVPAAAPAAGSESYTVVKGDSLWTVAKKHSVTVSELAAANNLKPGSVLRLGQKLIVPGKVATAGAPASASAPAGLGAPASAESQTYTVKAGDSLALIARRNGTTAATLKALNNLKTDIVRTGQVLALPTSSGSGANAASVETPAPAPAAKASRSASMVPHTVKAGETLGSIAKKYQVQVGEIAAANNISDPAKIRPGQELMIPGWQGSTAKKSPAATPAPAADNTPPPALSRTPPPAATPAPDSFLNTPTIGQDLDAGLQKSAEEVPVIKVEDSGAPKID